MSSTVSIPAAIPVSVSVPVPIIPLPTAFTSSVVVARRHVELSQRDTAYVTVCSKNTIYISSIIQKVRQANTFKDHQLPHHLAFNRLLKPSLNSGVSTLRAFPDSFALPLQP